MKHSLSLTAGLMATLLSGTAAFAQADNSVRIVLSEELDVVDPCFAARSNIGRVVLQNINETLTEFDIASSELSRGSRPPGNSSTRTPGASPCARA